MHVTGSHHVSSLQPFVADDLLVTLEPSIVEHPDFHDGWGPLRERLVPLVRQHGDRGAGILVTDADAERLERVIARHRGTHPVHILRRTLERAAVVHAPVIPDDIITMNSRVLCEDEWGTLRELQLVYPAHANAHDDANVSVLSSLGAALLGRSAGASTSVPEGERGVRVRDVTYQPEREGHFHL